MLLWFVGRLSRREIFVLPQHILHRRGSLAPKARYYVGVGIEGLRDVSMPKRLLDELGMPPWERRSLAQVCLRLWCSMSPTGCTSSATPEETGKLLGKHKKPSEEAE